MASRTEHRSWLRILIILAAIVLLAPLLMMAFMMPMMGMMGWWSVDGAPPGTGVTMVGGLGMLLVCLLVLLGIGYILYRLFTGLWPSVENPALEELRVAYARGELSREEFEQRREDLRQSR